MPKNLVTDDDYLGVGLWPEDDEIPPTYEPQYLAAPVHLLSPQAVLAWYRKHPSQIPPVAPPATPGVLANVGIFGFSDPGTNLRSSHLPLTAAYGQFALSAAATALTYSGGAPGTYTLTSNLGAFSLHGDSGPVMPAVRGAFALSGPTTNLVYTSGVAGTGSFGLTGQPATLTYSSSAATILRDETGVALLDGNGNQLLAA